MLSLLAIAFDFSNPWSWVLAVGAVGLLAFAATLLSIYNQEKRVPTLERVWRLLVIRVSHFPSSLAHRARTAPHRVRHSLRAAKFRFFHRIAGNLVFMIPKNGKRERGNALLKWISAHRFPMDESLLFPVKHNARLVPLAEALLATPPLKRVDVKASHVEWRFSSKRWNAFEVHAQHLRIWAISRKKLIPKQFAAELHRSAKGIYLIYR